MTQRTYAIRFDFPGGLPGFGDRPCYAGLHKGAYGWAPSLKTAILFDSADAAIGTLQNAYGEGSRKFARVIEVTDGGPA